MLYKVLQRKLKSPPPPKFQVSEFFYKNQSLCCGISLAVWPIALWLVSVELLGTTLLEKWVPRGFSGLLRIFHERENLYCMQRLAEGQGNKIKRTCPIK